MSISDDKIKVALSKIENTKKNIFVTAVLKDITEIEKAEDPMLQMQKLINMQEVFAEISEKTKDDSIEIYNGTMDSLANAISEHAKILTEQAKEALSKFS